MPTTESSKAKIAKRVVEVLEFFDEDHPQATVMDIVRRYNRPQSSTSELLSSLVNLGLLYKDPYSRSYMPTPRAAMLGCSVQSGIVRDGRLSLLIDQLSAQTRLGVAVIGMVGVNAQIYSWRGGKQPIRTAQPGGLASGRQESLTSSAAGWLLLSTLPLSRREGVIRRLNAEAPVEQKFVQSEMSALVQHCQAQRFANGVAGFGSIANVAALLLPDQPENQPLAIALFYEPSEAVNVEALRLTMRDAVERHTARPVQHNDNVERLVSVA